MDHAGFTLNWLLTNPYNNRLQWQADGNGLALSASHEFTSLAPDAPMTLRLYLGDADPLAGAKRYRQWLVEQGRYEPLADKLRQTPEAEKLLGASHLYLWGNSLLALDDVRDWSKFITLLRGHELKGLMDNETLQVLGKTTALNRYEQTLLLRGVNAAINNKVRQAWQVETPDMARLAARYGELRSELAVDFAGALSHPRNLGQQSH